jgi:hypothetical protein
MSQLVDIAEVRPPAAGVLALPVRLRWHLLGSQQRQQARRERNALGEHDQDGATFHRMASLGP